MLLGFHLWSLGFFPFVHSDEAWLASLTRTMMNEGSLAVTEDFFHLTERNPHAIKVLFHVMQVPFLALSFNHLAARALSLLASLGALVCFASALRRSGLSPVASLLFILLLALDVQFFYISHLARQEVLLVLVMCAGLAIVMPLEGWSIRKTLQLGTLLGLSIGLHPNAFVVSLPFFCFLMWNPGSLRRKGVNTLLLAAILGAFGALFVLLSYRMDPDFLSNYFAFGESVGVGDSPLQRFLRLRTFFEKLFRQTAGTYYLPPIRAQLLIFGGLVISAVPCSLVVRQPWRRRILSALSGVVAVILGLYIVGKFSPPSAVFIWPPIYLLAAMIYAGLNERYLDRLGKKHNFGSTGIAIAVTFLLVATTIPTIRELAKFREHPYRDYIEQISQTVPPNATVLANLNAAFAFPSGELYVYRDLDRLETNVVDFLEAEDIEYVLVPTELEIIFRERPQWNLLYGNLYPWFEDLHAYLQREGRLLSAFDAPVYAMRIVPYIFDRDARVEVYYLE